MMPDEKSELLTLLSGHGTWCRDAEARDANGEPVQYDDPSAVAWDLTGALCRLFGWKRACTLFGQLDRGIHGKRRSFGWPAPDSEMEAMRALQNYNDRTGMTLEMIRDYVESIPTWKGITRQTQRSPTRDDSSSVCG